MESAWFIPGDIANVDDVGVLLAGIVAVAVIAVVVIPLLLFGIELIIVGVVVAGSIVARSALGRPWIVHATSSANPADTLTWEVKGWRDSTRLIDEVGTALAAGLPPPPTDPKRATPG